jgi:sarcosine oxidase subunit beta
MGGTEVEGVLRRRRLGHLGLKAGPVSGEAMARCIAEGRAPEIIEGRSGSGRFGAGELVGEGAAAVGH